MHRTSGFIVRFLPVKNDEWRAALHSNHSDIGRRYARRTGHILIVAIVVREVSEGGGDRARLIWLLICLVDHMGSYKKGRNYSFIHATLFKLLFLHAVVPSSVTRELLISMRGRCKLALMKSYLQSASCPWCLPLTSAWAWIWRSFHSCQNECLKKETGERNWG